MNRFFGSFLTKIILFTLAGAFHFSAFGWEASESNCGSNIANGISMTGERTITAGNSQTTESVYTSAEQAQLDGRKRDCDRFYERLDREREEQRDEEEREREEKEKEVEEQLEFAKEQAEKAEEEKQRALEEQQDMMEQAQNECKSSYEDVVHERKNIESKVTNIQERMDRMEDAITKHYASISEGEDKVRDEILRLRREERQVMNSFKSKRVEAEKVEQGGDQALQEAIEGIEEDLYNSVTTLEDITRAKEQICSDRSTEYLKISVECYNEKLVQVTAEREELFKRIGSGNYTASNVSNLFQMDSQNIDQTFKRRLDALHTHCFSEKTGESLPHPGQSLAVQIPCDLQVFEQRARDCKEDSNQRACPATPVVQAIEQKVLAQLRQIERDVQKIERAREKAVEHIQKLKDRHEEEKGWMAKALADLEEELRLAKKDFKEKHERAENALLRVRETAENSILQLERDKIRLLSSDPARHFEEQLVVARVSCCHSASPQQTAQQCALLSRYEQDSSRFQFAFARPLPALRSASGPSSTRSSSNQGGASSNGTR